MVNPHRGIGNDEAWRVSSPDGRLRSSSEGSPSGIRSSRIVVAFRPMSPRVFRDQGYRSGVEVTNVFRAGIWLLAGRRELFLPYREFPWFREATIAAVLNVEEPAPGHFYWPDLDVDLDIQAIEHPERFPLKYK